MAKYEITTDGGKYLVETQEESSVNPRDIVAKDFSPEGIDSSQADMAKGILYHKTKGYDINDSNAEFYRQTLYGKDSSWSAVNKKLANDLSVEPKGPVKKAAQVSPSYLAMSGRGIMGKLSEGIHRAISGMMTIDTGTVVEKVLPVTGLVGFLTSSYANTLGIDISEAIDKPFEKAIKFKRGIAEEVRKQGALSKETWERGIPEEVRQSFPYQAVSGLGEIPMLALYAIPPVGAAVTASRYLDEGYTEAKQAGKIEQESQNIALGYASIFAPLGMLVDRFTLGIGKTATKPVAGTIGKNILRQSGAVFKQAQKAGAGEFITETAESAYLQKQATGKINWKQALTEGSLAYISGTIGGQITGTANSIDATYSANQLKKLGIDEQQASVITEQLASAKTRKEQLAITEEVATHVLEKTGEVERLIDAISNPVEGQMESTKITGFNGGAMASDDFATLRNQTELIDNLIPSKEADTLKKAVIEKDGSAEAEYSQGLVGTEEIQEVQNAISIRETTQVPMGETPTDSQTMDGQIRVKGTTQEGEEIITEPEVINGIPSIVGMSRKQNNALNAVIGFPSISKADYVSQTESLQRAIDDRMYENTEEYIKRAENGGQLKHEEIAALLVRKTQIINDIDTINKQLVSAKGNDELIADLAQQLTEKIDAGVRITEAARKGTTENARALAAMAMAMDRKSFELINVMSEAKAVKGTDLTPEEKAQIQEKVNELNSVEEEIQSLEQGDVDERTLILDEIERAYRRIRKPGKSRTDKNADLKLIRSRQNTIFSLIKEINQGKDKANKIKNVSNPDSEGYLEMITELKKQLQELRKQRSLDTQISKLETDISTGDIQKYGEKKPSKEVSKAILERQARKLALQQEINRQLSALKPKTMMDWVWDAYDVFRGLRLTADQGHLLRQGGFVMSNPKMWKDAKGTTFFKESAKAFIKQNADITEAKIMESEHYQDAVLAGLRLIQEGQKLDAREEILIKGLINKIPVIGKVQEGFGRSQITGVNLLRMTAFESYLADNPNATLEEKKDIAFAINILTGYGQYKSGSGAVERALNKLLVSPRFSASRFQAPVLLAMSRDGNKIWNNKPLRNRIIQDTAYFMGIRMALMYLASLMWPDEISIGTNPEHFTYGRLVVRVGNGQVRIYDPWAGIQSALKTLQPILQGEGVPATLKKITEGRQHPALTGLNELYSGKEMYGTDISRGAALLKMITPITVEGAKEAIEKDTGLIDLIASVATDFVGIGSVLINEEDLEGKMTWDDFKEAQYKREEAEFNKIESNEKD